MNVLYVLDAFPKLSESFVLNEIYELERRGHDVVVCARRSGDDEILHEEYDDLDVPVGTLGPLDYGDAREIISPRTLHPRILERACYRAPPTIHAANLVQTRRAIAFLGSIGWAPDHVHAHFPRRSRYPAALLAGYYGALLTVTAHAASLYKRPIHAATGALLSTADRIATISEYNRRHVRESFAPDTPVDVVHAGIRPEKFSPTGASAERRILTVARFVEKKGLRYALAAVARLVDDYPDLEYHVVGSGELEADLRRRTRDLGIEANVAFLDAVSDERLLREFDEAQCFLLPCVVAESGDRDGIPVVLMEAMAMCTPPVSTTVSGVPELIAHERNGILAAPRDPAALAAGLRRLLDHEERRRRYGHRARETVRAAFDVAGTVDDLVATFEAASRCAPPEPDHGDPQAAGRGDLRDGEPADPERVRHWPLHD
jgi:colanic acid/amylovoran biosynthesis glycosyltransferase